MLVLDELGFHQATSVAELLADRGCSVEIVTPGMVVGQDLGITLDLENFWIRAQSKGIVQTTELVPMGVEGGTLSLQHHPTGADGDPRARLARAGRAVGSGRRALPRAARGRRRRWHGSATPWRPDGPTPR